MQSHLKHPTNSPLLVSLSPTTEKIITEVIEPKKTLEAFLIEKMPKVDLHVHAEAGAFSNIALAKKIAEKNNLPFPDGLVDQNNQRWKYRGKNDFMQFINDFLQVSALIKTSEDVEAVAYDYYRQCYERNVIFSLPGISWIQCHNLTPYMYNKAHNKAIADGLETFSDVSILRFRYYLERHTGYDAVKQTWETLKENPNPLITTIGLAGAEEAFPLAQFADIYQDIQAYRQNPKHQWFNLTAHMEGFSSADTIKKSLSLLDWVGHGRNAADNHVLLKDYDTTFEICPLSDIAVYPNDIPEVSDHHQLQTLLDKGLVTLSSDDPAFFGNITEVYLTAFHELNLSYADLLQCTINGIQPLREETLANIENIHPNYYQEMLDIQSVSMLKIQFFQIYWQLLNLAYLLPSHLQKQIVHLDLKSSLNNLTTIQNDLIDYPEMNHIFHELIQIKQKIIDLTRIINQKTLVHIKHYYTFSGGE